MCPPALCRRKSHGSQFGGKEVTFSTPCVSNTEDKQGERDICHPSSLFVNYTTSKKRTAMKKLLFLLFLAPVSITDTFLNLPAITQAINAGDANALGQFFDQSVEIGVPGKENIYSRAQAIGIVKDFFAQNAPKSFAQVHQAASKGSDSQYIIGNLVTASGTFRVYVYMSVAGGKHIIQELRFDKQ